MSNIVEQEIANPPASYEAYLYQYTNLTDGKVYVGIHKGSVDDSYNHSSTNEEFAKVFSNSKSKLKFEAVPKLPRLANIFPAKVEAVPDFVSFKTPPA